mgnify:CR=1 FL=1
MTNIYQKTLCKEVNFEGVGLHSGKISKVRLLPAEEDKGIIFKRTDLKEKNIIKACYKNVSSTNLCTTIRNQNNTEVQTVEHLIAAFYLTGIDNVIVEIDNVEVPIMDGSSKEFISIINKVGLKKQNSQRKFLKINEKINYTSGEKSISISPNDKCLEINYELNYDNKVIGKQRNEVILDSDNLEHIYNSRTFCLYEDVEKIKKQGLAKGGSLDNAIVVDKDKVINSEGLRNEKEFVNHKILDLIGDLFLSGYRILGKVVCVQGGHQLNNNFVKKILSENNQINKKDYTKIKEFNKKYIIQNRKLAINA